VRTLIAAAALIAATITTHPAHAAPVTLCDGSVSDATVGRLQVPAGATCTLTKVTVEGNIRVLTDAALVIHDSTINGSVIGMDARTVQIIDTDVVGTGTSGNIHLTRTTGPIVIGSDGCRVDPSTGNNINLTDNHGTIAICYMTVGETVVLQGNDDRIGVFHNSIGNPLKVQHNTADFIRIRRNEIGLTGGGSMLVQNNVTTGSSRNPAGLSLRYNYTHNRLNCTGNVGAPTGVGNVADNGKLGQCVSL
jgi:hypothetical protein